MKLIKLLHSALLTSLMVYAISLPAISVYGQTAANPSDEEFFFGVTFGGNTTSEAKLLIDKVKGYTNLFVVDSWDICTSADGTALTEICEYAVNANMHILVYFNFIFYNVTSSIGSFYNATTWEDFGVTPWHIPWLNNATERWGTKFLGVYLYDEPGGKQIDTRYWGGNNVSRSGRPIRTFENVSDYSDAANRFVTSISRSRSMQLVTNTSIPNGINRRLPVFTSDYALYWFDYLAGYDTIFVELGWNLSRTQQIALCRGAANMMDKQWGAIITWTYNSPPYLVNGEAMLQDMRAAYQAGAKYLIVFNYPKINQYGLLAEEHFTAMETFWNQIHASSRSNFGEPENRVALVLPKDYGWGMRHLDDKIWGFWPSDAHSPLVWENMNKLTEMYGLKLDIVYDDRQFNLEGKYSQVYFWNSTTLSASFMPFESYVTLAIAAVPLSILTCVSAYYVMKLRKQRPARAVAPEFTAEARFRNLGNGTLELTNNTIKFYVKKGRIKKLKETVREIPIVDIENIERVGNEFTVAWKGATDAFVVEKTELVQAIYEKVNEALEVKRKTLEDKEAIKQKQDELAKILNIAMEIADSLFDILRGLHGRVNWNRVEGYLKRYEENVKNLCQTIGAISFESAKLLSALREHVLGDVLKVTCGILRSLYEYFSGLTAKTEIPESVHPNYRDTKAAILAYYTLNDIILGTVVEDEEIGKESKELVTLLEDLSKVTDMKINVDAVKDAVNKLAMEKGKENVIEESRATLRQQLKELITAPVLATKASAI